MRQIDRLSGFARLVATSPTASAMAREPMASSGRGAPSRTGRPLRRALDTLRLWQRRAQGRQQLRTFDDHLLRDIGITRLQAEAEANKPFWRA